MNKKSKTDKLMVAAVEFYKWMDDRCDMPSVPHRYRICEDYILGAIVMIRHLAPTKKSGADTEILVFRNKK